MPALGKLGKTGGELLKIDENKFTYKGSPSVIIMFDVKDNIVLSLTLNEPGLVLTAKKI